MLEKQGTVAMTTKYEKLKTELETGVQNLKQMTMELESGDLTKLSSQLQRIIEFSAELSRIIDDCEIYQRREEAEKAVASLVEAGFPFQYIEIDNMRFRVNEKKEIIFYEDLDDARR